MEEQDNSSSNSESYTSGETNGSSRTDTSSPEMLAEVVFLTTSLGSVKKQFFESNRAKHLLDCKGLVYYLVDTNKEISDATGCKDMELFESWKSEGFLRLCKDETGNESGKYLIHLLLVLPQIIIDGFSVGDNKFLQDLEDDGDLDYIVARILCPCCLTEKEIDVITCPKCNVEYKNIIPDEYVGTHYVRRFCQGYPC